MAWAVQESLAADDTAATSNVRAAAADSAANIAAAEAFSAAADFSDDDLGSDSTEPTP